MVAAGRPGRKGKDASAHVAKPAPETSSHMRIMGVIPSASAQREPFGISTATVRQSDFIGSITSTHVFFMLHNDMAH
jgi:hypothetical protein